MAKPFANSGDPDQMPHSGSTLFISYPFKGFQTTMACTCLKFEHVCLGLKVAGIVTLIRHRILWHLIGVYTICSGLSVPILSVIIKVYIPFLTLFIGTYLIP